MKLNKIFFLVILGVSVSSCSNKVEHEDIENKQINKAKYNQTISEVKKSNNNTETQNKMNYENKDSIEIRLGKVINVKDIKKLEGKIGAKLEKVDFESECGNFFNNNEKFYRLKNMNIVTSNNQAIITQIVKIPENYSIHYFDILINKDLKPTQINKQKFEIDSVVADKDYNAFSLVNTKIHYPFDIVYVVREKHSDELLNIYYFKNKLVGVEVIAQC